MRLSPLWNVTTTNSVSRSLGAIPLAFPPDEQRAKVICGLWGGFTYWPELGHDPFHIEQIGGFRASAPQS